MAAPHLEMLLVAVVDQCVEVGHRLDHDIATLAAVAAVRAAELDELLAMKADAAGAAVAAFHEDLGFIEEFHGCISLLGTKKKGNGPIAIPLFSSREWPRWELVPRRSHSVARLHRNEGAAIAGVLEAHGAGRLGEQGVVLAHADIGAGVELGAALAHQDVAGEDFFRTELLDAEAPAGGIATVAG